jgi:hypothetical protein
MISSGWECRLRRRGGYPAAHRHAADGIAMLYDIGANYQEAMQKTQKMNAQTRVWTRPAYPGGGYYCTVKDNADAIIRREISSGLAGGGIYFAAFVDDASQGVVLESEVNP